MEKIQCHVNYTIIFHKEPFSSSCIDFFLNEKYYVMYNLFNIIIEEPFSNICFMLLLQRLCYNSSLSAMSTKFIIILLY